MTHDNFVKKYIGRYLDYDGVYRAQCVDLLRGYLKEVYGDNPYVSIPNTGYAKNIYYNFRDNKYFTKIPNTPTGVPKKGDIIFWGTYPFVTGVAGHVGIFEEGGVYAFSSFDQNYAPVGSPCHFVKHSYKGVLGWLRRK